MIATLILALLLIAPVSAQASEATLAQLLQLDQFRGDLSHLTNQFWVDPYEGDDANDGSYATPWRSLRKLKESCFDVAYTRCTVKGAHRVFSNRTLTMSSAAAFIDGEPVTWTNPIAGNGAGSIVEAYEEYLTIEATSAAAVTWNASTDPIIGSVVTGTWSGASATVNDYADTISGVASTLIEPAQITTGATAVFTVQGHPYANGEGPLVWLMEPTFAPWSTTEPTFTGFAITENSTEVFVCAVTANTFELDNSSGCAGTRLGISSAGTSRNQLIYRELSVPGNNPTSEISMSCNAADRHKICVLLEGESPSWKWGIHGGGYNIQERRAVIHPENWGGLATGGSYNTSNGTLLGVVNSPADLSQGWFGVQNGWCDSVANDCLATGVSGGGKLVALNFEARDMRNGESDRSQALLSTVGVCPAPASATCNPAWQAHNSCFQALAGLDGTLDGVAYWINSGNSSAYMGSDQRSGACLNARQDVAFRLISAGTFTLDSFLGDTNCSGAPCPSGLAVYGQGDSVIVGPTFNMGGVLTRNRFHPAGSGRWLEYYRSTFNFAGADSLTASTQTQPWMTLTPIASGAELDMVLNEVTITGNGGYAFMSTCEIDPGPPPGRISIIGRNVRLDGQNGNKIITVGSSCGAPGDQDDFVENTTFNLRGAYDEALNPNDVYTTGVTSRGTLGVAPCGGAPNSWRKDICAILTAATLPTTQWQFFLNTSDFDTTPYTVPLQTRLVETVDGDSCLTESVTGTQHCSLSLTPGGSSSGGGLPITIH